MREWWDKYAVGIVLTLIVVIVIGLTIWMTWGDCAHGHHVGVCGRQYKSGKYHTLRTCECVKDHY